MFQYISMNVSSRLKRTCPFNGYLAVASSAAGCRWFTRGTLWVQLAEESELVGLLKGDTSKSFCLEKQWGQKSNLGEKQTEGPLKSSLDISSHDTAGSLKLHPSSWETTPRSQFTGVEVLKIYIRVSLPRELFFLDFSRLFVRCCIFHQFSC